MESWYDLDCVNEKDTAKDLNSYDRVLKPNLLRLSKLPPLTCGLEIKFVIALL